MRLRLRLRLLEHRQCVHTERLASSTPTTSVGSILESIQLHIACFIRGFSHALSVEVG